MKSSLLKKTLDSLMNKARHIANSINKNSSKIKIMNLDVDYSAKQNNYNNYSRMDFSAVKLGSASNATLPTGAAGKTMITSTIYATIFIPR